MTVGKDDDHIGFASIPLSSVPAEGLEKWTVLKPMHKLEVRTLSPSMVSGRSD